MDDVEHRRSYSICVPPSAGVLRIGVKQLPGGAFSDVVVNKLAPGDELDVMTPAGRFTHVPDPAAERTYVAVAAGSGITRQLSGRTPTTPGAAAPAPGKAGFASVRPRRTILKRSSACTRRMAARSSTRTATRLRKAA